MDTLSFIKWLEQKLGEGFGGIHPPKQSAIDPDPSPGQTNAFMDYTPSEEPPTSTKRMKKKMKKKMKK